MRSVLKRWFDIGFSAVGLVALSPIIAGIAVLIVLGSPGPILYRGVRVGRRGRSFRMLKFRTMRVDADKQGASSTAGDDPRITRIGRILRAGKLDELPQLWNVLVGEMSFVGPRPQVQWAVDLYTSEERQVLEVRPGITDYASIRFRNEGEILRGSTDPDRDYMEKIAPEKMRLGRYYVYTYSLVADIRLIFATIGSIAGVTPDWALPTQEAVNAVLKRESPPRPSDPARAIPTGA